MVLCKGKLGQASGWSILNVEGGGGPALPAPAPPPPDELPDA